MASSELSCEGQLDFLRTSTSIRIKQSMCSAWWNQISFCVAELKNKNSFHAEGIYLSRSWRWNTEREKVTGTFVRCFKLIQNLNILSPRPTREKERTNRTRTLQRRPSSFQENEHSFLIDARRNQKHVLPQTSSSAGFVRYATSGLLPPCIRGLNRSQCSYFY